MNHLLLFTTLVYLLVLSGCDTAANSDPVAEIASIEISSAIAERANFTIPTGEAGQLNANASDADGMAILNPSISWSSSNTSVATVDDKGAVTAVSPGVATITATGGNQSDAVTFNVYDITGTWVGAPDGNGDVITLDLTQSGTDVTGTFENTAWLNSGIPEAGRGPVTGVLEWDRLIHSIAVSQGCIWTLTARVQIIAVDGDVHLQANETSDPWQITSDCGGGGVQPIPVMQR